MEFLIFIIFLLDKLNLENIPTPIVPHYLYWGLLKIFIGVKESLNIGGTVEL